jgi:MFS transporter, DHA2 family, multidrug resistance protein
MCDTAARATLPAMSATATAVRSARDDGPLVGHHVDARAYRQRWKTLGVLSLSLLIIGLDNTVLNVALPTLQTHFAASGSTLQWIVDAYLLAFAGVLLTMGTLGDRLGRKRALQSGLVLFGVASVLAAFAQDATQLIALRALMGIGGAMIMPATLSVIMDVFPREERGKAIGIWSAIAGVGIGLGPFVGGLLLEWFSWSSVFWLNVPIVVAALAAGFAWVPESRDPRPGAFDLPGAVLSIATLVTLVYGIIEASPRGWTDPLVLGCFGAAALLGLAFVLWERWVTAPMLPLGFFRDPRFTVASVGVALVFFAMMGSVFAFTQYLQFAHGFSALEAGAAMLPLALGLVIGSGASNRLATSLGRRRVIAGGLFGVAAVLSTSLAWTPDMAPALLALVTFGLALSMGAAMAPATDSVMSAVPEAKAGVGSAMSDVTRQVGGALGVAVIGSIVGTAYSRGVSDASAAAGESIGAAHAAAERVGGAAGRELADTAGRAFTDALGIGLTAAAAIAVAGAVLILLRLPDGPAAVVAGEDAAAAPSTIRSELEPVT